MKKIKILLLTGLGILLITSCFEDLDDNAIGTAEINDFVWKAMNTFYVYKDNIPDLANDRFSSNNDYTDYLNSFSNPEDIFESLIYLPEDVDEFSVIVPNYFDLEQQLQGTTLNNGMAYGLIRAPNDAPNIFGYVRYVLPNSDAESKGISRGLIFNAVDGIQLTESNFSSLLGQSTYTINIAEYDNNGTFGMPTDDVITTTNESITLTKSIYTENPILLDDVFEVANTKIGYLMYNGFRSGDSNLSELNAVFGQFQSQGVSELVLDLRYNGGGSVATALWLSSMITGQFTGNTFFTERWNSEIQLLLEEENPEALINPFVNEMKKFTRDGEVTFQETINSLNLNKIYVLTTRSTASASELVINSLSPYIDVIQIGLNTRGKSQASITLYDSRGFIRENVNPRHTYALQPLIYESANINGFSSYYDGLNPTPGFAQAEHYEELGELGDITEPLLATAIGDITGSGRPFISTHESLEEINDNNFNHPFLKEMVDERSITIQKIKQ